ncbi:MAG TPA: SPOR domain-containing protein [Candidatus Dormibacteraeota bacterium]|nr:SPOR domain-containing protein [Candidatus Dormibacteraeota bacterium]
MASSEDTEITLGTGKLLVLFFGLVGICALFFALGYSLGRKSEPAMNMAGTPAPSTSSSATKAGGGSGTAATPPMTFYKAVEQKDANPELTPPADAKTDTTTAPANGAGNPGTNPAAATAPPVNAPDAGATLPTLGYFVQVAAVSKQEDADALVDALKKKEYPAFVAAQVANDKLFRVQLGPFSEVKDAEAMRTRLVGDGYSPILKK